MQYLADISSNFIFTWDLGIIVFLFFAAFFYGLNAGVRRLVSLLLSLYFATILISSAPYLDRFFGAIEGFKGIAVEAAVYLGAAIVMFLFISGSVLRVALRAPKKEESRWWHLLLLSFITAGFLAASVLAFLPESYYNNLSAVTLEIFVFNNAIFWWSLAGIISFILLRKTKKKV